MSQYLIIALVWAASLVSVGAWQHSAGVNSQKVADQVEFDRINAQTADMKAQANKAYWLVQDANVQAMKERDLAKTAILKEKQTNVETINALRTRYANVGMRYSTGQVAGLRNGSANALPGTGNAASNVTPVERELPAAITAGLRAIAYDCDALNVEYRVLYKWANPE